MDTDPLFCFLFIFVWGCYGEKMSGAASVDDEVVLFGGGT